MNDPSLHPVICRYIEQNDLENVEGAFAFVGGEDLVKPGLGLRRRTRLRVCDEENRCWEMYLKRYESPGWITRLWRCLTGRRSGCPAQREYESAKRLRKAGVSAMRPVIWGADVGLLGVKRSYVIVSAVPGDSLERIGEDFLQRNLQTPGNIESLTDALVRLVHRMHEVGYVHRDLYASHIFLHDYEGRIELYLIDLARTLRPRWRTFRWRVKDLAQLKYSMPWVWVKMSWSRFLHGYLAGACEKELERWETAIDAKVKQMARHDQRNGR